MNGLPENFTGEVFLGKVVEMICFNANQIYLHLSGKVSIVIEGEFSHETWQGNGVEHIKVPVRSSGLMSLLEVSIVTVKIKDDRHLVLEFSDQQRLTIWDSSAQFETYKIVIDGKEMIV